MVPAVQCSEDKRLLYLWEREKKNLNMTRRKTEKRKWFLVNKIRKRPYLYKRRALDATFVDAESYFRFIGINMGSCWLLCLDLGG